MLMPKKVKYRKQQRGRMAGKAWRGSDVSFGDFGLKALEPCWLTDRQIEAARVAMTRFVTRGGKIWVRVFPDKPITKKPQETRMGKGKGAPDQWVAVVRAGPRAVRDGRRQREGRARSDAAGGREAADGHEVRDALRAGEDAMKAAELREPRRRRTGRAGARSRRISCSGCGSRSRWVSSRRRNKCRRCAATSRAIKTVLRQKGDKRTVGQPMAREHGREKVGVVVSNKMQKSVVVAVEWQVRHGLYGKTERLHVEVHGARREERGQDRRHRRDRRDAGRSAAASAGR